MLTLASAVAAFASFASVHAHVHADGSFCGYEQDMEEQRQALLDAGESPVVAPRGVLNPERHPPHPRTARALEEQQWRPLRIHVDYVNVTAFGASDLAYFKTNVVEPAVAMIQDTMRVRQRTDDSVLFLGRKCASQTWVNGEWKCGEIRTGDGSCGGEVLSESYYGEATQYSSNGDETTVPGGTGAPNADFILVVTAKSTDVCGAATLAYASACLRDDIDRPIAGRYNQCPTKLKNSPAAARKQTMVAVHEMMHSLGFSSDSFALFRDPDTLDPLFPTDSNGWHPTISTQRCGSQEKFPASMVEFTSERGQPACSSIEDAARIGRDKCTQRVVLPKTKQAAREWFACNEINGPELENQDTSCGLVASHWEQRSMFADLMTPVSMEYNMITPMTLAFFEASGWYQGNYDSTHLVVSPGREWGHQAGCDIHKKRGVYPADPTQPYADLQVVKTASAVRNDDPFFCLDGGPTNYCSFDLRATGQCQASYYGFAMEEEFRYFSEVNKAGNLEQLDLLPYIASIWMCGESQAGTDRAALWQEIGAYYGSQHDSACFVTSLKHGNIISGSAAGCYRYSCDRTDPTSPILTIQPQNANGDGVQRGVVCNKGDGGQTRSVIGMDGTITCVEPELLCGPNTVPSPTPSASSSPSPSASSSPVAANSSSPSPAAASGNGGSSGGDTGDGGEPSPSTAPDTSPSLTPSTSAAPVAMGMEELTSEYCPGTADAHTSGDYPSVAGARLSLAGVAGDLSCDAAPDLQAACASVLDVEASRVAVKVPGASAGRRLQGAGGSQQEVTVAVAAQSAQEAALLSSTLVASVSSGTLATELATENSAVFQNVATSVSTSGGSPAVFSGSLPPAETTGSDGDDEGSNGTIIAIGVLAGLIAAVAVGLAIWSYTQKQGQTQGSSSKTATEPDQVASVDAGAAKPSSAASSKGNGAAAASV